MDSEEVKKIRLQFGLTQEQFAQRLGVTHGTIARWERGGSVPSPLAIEKLNQFKGKTE
jgi:putative transcriptional regulator